MSDVLRRLRRRINEKFRVSTANDTMRISKEDYQAVKQELREQHEFWPHSSLPYRAKAYGNQEERIMFRGVRLIEGE